MLRTLLDSTHVPLHPLFIYIFHYILYNKSINVSTSFFPSSVSHYSKLLNLRNPDL